MKVSQVIKMLQKYDGDMDVNLKDAKSPWNKEGSTAVMTGMLVQDSGPGAEPFVVLYTESPWW